VPTKQTGGFDDQYGDDQGQCDRQFQLIADARDVGAGEVLDDADQEAADDGAERKLPIALALIITVLVFKPAGLFGRAIVKRV